MRRVARIALAFVIMILMFSQVAFAANCDFTFTANGKTYYATHHATDGYYECFNPEPDTSPSFNDPSPEHLAYSLAFRAAKAQHHAVCPYVNDGDLGDARIPMAWLYGGVVLVAISAVIVHWKRMRIQ